MLHRIQSPLTKQPNRPGGLGHAGLKFGALTGNQLQPYQDVLNRLGPKQYKPNNLATVQDKFLTERAKDRLEEIHGHLDDSRKFQSLYKKHYLGPASFASEMLFEMYTLAAIRENILPAKLIKELAEKKIIPDDRSTKDFPQILNEVETELEKHDRANIKFFQNLVGGNSQQAKQVLSLIAIKLLLQHIKEPKASGLGQAKTELHAATKEFNSHFPWYSPRRIQTWLMTAAYSHLSFLSVEWFRCQMLSIVRDRVSKELKYEDLMKQLEESQSRRQEVAYFHPEESQSAIKRQLHGMELMHEALIVENAVLGHYR